MIAAIEQLLEEYAKWLRDRSSIKEISPDLIEITTPFLDRHNDYLQIYAKQNPNGILLSDDGYVIRDLRSSGCTLETKKRKDLLYQTLAGFGVSINGDELSVVASNENFPLRKHNLLQAMLAVNDLFYLATPTVTSLFLDDVREWLRDNDVPFVSNLTFHGRSGYEHRFDFALPETRKLPERVIRISNHPDRGFADSLIYAWLDTRETRSSNSKAFAILNDSDAKTLASVVEALTSYDITPILWSDRGDGLNKLSVLN